MINEYTNQLLQELGLTNAPEAEKLQVVDMLTERFSHVIIYTTLNHLNSKQKMEFSESLKNSGNVEEKVAEMAASIPGLWDSVIESLTIEYQALKQGMQN